MTAESATALRRPFPPESVGKLPKGGTMLDFVGHAAVTDRLLAVDPEWSWDFAETDPATGQPSPRYSIDPEKNLWIRLTVCGVTRIGVGDGPNAKERIGDALRNAAMRFGVGLDLWAKENLVEFAQAANTARRVADPSDTKAPEPEPVPDRGGLNGGSNSFRGIADKSMREMFALFRQKGIAEAEQQLAGINQITGKQYESRAALSEDDARKVIAELRKRPDVAPAVEGS